MKIRAAVLNEMGAPLPYARSKPLRIEEVEKEGASRVRHGKESSGLVTPFPLPVWTPGRGPHQG